MALCEREFVVLSFEDELNSAHFLIGAVASNERKLGGMLTEPSLSLTLSGFLR